MLYSFVFFMLAFLGVGLASMRYSQPTTEDYLLAGKNVKPWLVALSFFATDNSGFMFVGLIGAIYMLGVSALWIPLGWFLGVLSTLWFVAPVWRKQNDKVQAHTYSGLLARWTGEDFKWVRYLSAIIIILFLSVYAAGQFSAGGKALNVLFGWDVSVGAIVGFVMVLAYCLAGGIRATIWTDAVQSVALLGSMVLVVVYALLEVGGVGALFDMLRDTDPSLIDVFSGSYKFGFPAFVVGWFFGGSGVLGQSQSMVRFMVIDDAKNVRRALIYYFVMVMILSVLCMLGGMAARVLFPELINSDPELSLPMIASTYMPKVLGGLFLAGLFAAAMSTADSQILSSSAALTNDIIPSHKKNVLWSKGGTVFVALLALGIALSGSQSVFKLMTFAWSVMGGATLPLILIYVLGRRPAQAHIIMMMLGGAAASTWWEVAGLSGDLYNVLPGVVAGLLIYLIPLPLLKKKA